MTTAIQFQKAERTSVKLKLGIQGPSGSGKTMGALALARTLFPDGKIAVIDTENESASYYADDYDFATFNLTAPFTSARYVEALKAAIAAGFDVCVIDTISHQWAGPGGILDRKEEADKRPGSNSYTNWATFTKEHELFKTRLLEAQIHIIATLRTKQDYALEDNERGKKAPVKLGMAPIQREGFEYEFGIAFELQMDHRAKASKDRTGLFGDELLDLKDPKVGKTLRQWLRSGKPALVEAPKQPETPDLAVELTIDAAEEILLPGSPGSWGGRVGEPLSAFTDKQLVSIRQWLRDRLDEKENAEYARVAQAITMILDDRAEPEEGDEKNDLFSTDMPLDGAVEAAATEAVGGKRSTNVKMPKPGRVVDALEPVGANSNGV
jgi:hypothetical protein